MRARFPLASVLVLASACGQTFSTATDTSDSGANSQANGATNGNSGSSGAGANTASDGGRNGSGGRTGTGGVGAGGASVPSDGGSPSDGGALGTGGIPDTGGAQSNGGFPSTGGALASSGGARLTGGTTSTGGLVSTGGSPTGGAPTGGAVSTGGANTGGFVATGGVMNTGGARPSGGAMSTGGVPTGGVVNSGGAPTGGVVGSGGVTNTGGVTGSGGGPDCPSTCAQQGLACCHGGCVNTNNDPYNCGGCDKVCQQDQFFCSGGFCGPPICFIGPPPPPPSPNGPDASLPNGPSGGGPVPIGCILGQFCCGNLCCNIGQICCEVPAQQVNYQCIDPVGGATCPVGCAACVCAAPDTPIATPNGDRAIATLKVGDLVYSVSDGHVVTVPLVEVHRIPAPHHVVVHVELSNGAVLEISPPHPTADGRLFADLRAGDVLGGTTVTNVTRVPYKFEYTYDILPASETGTYFAGGVAIGSTLGGSALRSGAVDGTALTVPR